MRSTLNIETLISSVTSILKEEMRLERIDLLLIESKSGNVIARKEILSLRGTIVTNQSQETDSGQIPSGSPRSFRLRESYGGQVGARDDIDKLINLVKTKDILITDEIPDPNPDKDLLREKNIACIIPLKVDKKLIGILILSEKKSGDMYSLQDINFLLTLSSQLSIACNNALSFDEVVKDREKIKRLLNEREKLDKMKDEFIAIASHEVNTPLTIAQGYLSLVLEGEAGKLEPNIKTFVSKTYHKMKKINIYLNELMRRSGIVGKKK